VYPRIGGTAIYDPGGAFFDFLVRHIANSPKTTVCTSITLLYLDASALPTNPPLGRSAKTLADEFCAFALFAWSFRSATRLLSWAASPLHIRTRTPSDAEP
jgi:hypothetical protein